MMLRVFQHRHNQSAYGPYQATVVWAAGCSIQCAGCFNPQLFEAKSGRLRSPLWLLNLAWKGRQLGDTVLALVGGEPLDQAKALLPALLLVRLLLPGMKVTIYSGYRYEHLIRSFLKRLALRCADVLVDGPFIQRLAADDLGYRGSANQRVIDLKASRTAGRAIVLDWDRLIMIGNKTITAPPALAASLELAGAAEACGEATKEEST